MSNTAILREQTLVSNCPASATRTARQNWAKFYAVAARRVLRIRGAFDISSNWLKKERKPLNRVYFYLEKNRTKQRSFTARKTVKIQFKRSLYICCY